MSTRQQQIAELARNAKGALTSIHHHLDHEWLREAYSRLRKNGAPGIDGQTVTEYGQKLESKLEDLRNRILSGRYKAPPVKRVHIPKGDGRETRPIGIPTVEDKLVQRAVCMLLEPIYEGEFYDFSYGFRPGRGAHQALLAVWKQIMSNQIEWIVDVDIRKFFDTLDHGQLRAILDKRVRDGALATGFVRTGMRASKRSIKASWKRCAGTTRITGSPETRVACSGSARVFESCGLNGSIAGIAVVTA